MLILRGKQSKHWSRKKHKQIKICALMHWSFSLLNDDTKCLFWGVNNRNTEAKIITKKTKKMRLDALIIFLIEWPHQVLYLRGKLSKYWSQKKHNKTKNMRLDAVIIFVVEWRHQVLILRGKLSKYWSQKKRKNDICIIKCQKQTCILITVCLISFANDSEMLFNDFEMLCLGFWKAV